MAISALGLAGAAGPIPAPTLTLPAARAVPEEEAERDCPSNAEDDCGILDGNAVQELVNRRVLRPRPETGPERLYKPRPQPKEWSLRSAAGVPGHTFRYTKAGALDGSITFNASLFWHFMRQHPLNTQGGRLLPKESQKLVLYLQVTPTQQYHRYADPRDAKCRFENCPSPFRTIRRGFLRVAICEEPLAGIDYDPYHNAGYMHLWCLEQAVDLAQLAHHFRFQIDERRFILEQKNHMRLDCWKGPVVYMANAWLEYEVGLFRSRLPQVETRRRAETDQLGYLLTKTAVESDAVSRQQMRDLRGNFSLDKHLGNLELYEKWCRQRNYQRSAVGYIDGRSVGRANLLSHNFRRYIADRQLRLLGDDTVLGRATATATVTTGAKRKLAAVELEGEDLCDSPILPCITVPMPTAPVRERPAKRRAAHLSNSVPKRQQPHSMELQGRISPGHFTRSASDRHSPLVQSFETDAPVHFPLTGQNTQSPMAFEALDAASISWRATSFEPIDPATSEAAAWGAPAVPVTNMSTSDSVAGNMATLASETGDVDFDFESLIEW